MTAEHVIVCGVDGSPAAQRALVWALDEAKRRECTLRVVTVWSWDGLEAFGAPGGPDEARADAQLIQQNAIEDALGQVESPPLFEPQVVRGGTSEVLTDAERGADLLVIGSHGHSAVHDKLIGSTSARVIRHATCPV